MDARCSYRASQGGCGGYSQDWIQGCHILVYDGLRRAYVYRVPGEKKWSWLHCLRYTGPFLSSLLRSRYDPTFKLPGQIASLRPGVEA